MFSSPWHLLLFDRLGVTIIGTLTIIGGSTCAQGKSDSTSEPQVIYTVILEISTEASTHLR